MDELTSLEGQKLDAAIESGRNVKLIMVSGYQTLAVIKDYDCNVITVDVKGHEWMVYRHAVATIVLEGF